MSQVRNRVTQWTLASKQLAAQAIIRLRARQWLLTKTDVSQRWVDVNILRRWAGGCKGKLPMIISPRAALRIGDSFIFLATDSAVRASRRSGNEVQAGLGAGSWQPKFLSVRFQLLLGKGATSVRASPCLRSLSQNLRIPDACPHEHFQLVGSAKGRISTCTSSLCNTERQHGCFSESVQKAAPHR